MPYVREAPLATTPLAELAAQMAGTSHHYANQPPNRAPCRPSLAVEGVKRKRCMKEEDRVSCDARSSRKSENSKLCLVSIVNA